MINEELKYMKYLLGYQRGVVISEQKILLKENKSDYEQILSQLSQAYGSILKKYGFDGIVGNGTKNNYPDENFDDFPSLIKITGTYTDKDGKTTDGTYFSCKSGTKIVTPGSKILFAAPVPSNTDFVTTNQSSYNYQYRLKEPDETKRRALADQFDKAIANIAVKVCELLNLKEKGQDVTKQIQAVVDSETKAQQTKTTGVKTTTQQTATKPGTTATTKPGTTATTKPKTGGQNPIYDKPIINVTKQGNVWKVNTFGSFPIDATEGGLAKAFIKEFVSKVFGDPVLQKTKGDIGITFARIRGGASNYNNGAVLPDIKFDSSKPTNYISYTKIDKTKLDATKYPGDLTTNTTLANDRALNLFKEMKKLLPNLKSLAPDIFAEIQKNNPGTTPKVLVDIEPTVEGFNVDTGGVTDKQRDTNLYPVPGQHVYMDLTVQIEPNKVKSAACMKGLTLEVTHSPHDCDLGQYNLYINNELIGMSDVSTKTLGTRSQPTLAKAEQGVILNKYTNGKTGDPYGVRKDTFTIPEASVAKFLAKSTKGEVRITGQEWQPGRHADQPFFTVKNASGAILLNNFSPAKATPCTSVPCPKFDMVVFNPCSDDPASAILGNDYGLKKEEPKKT